MRKRTHFLGKAAAIALSLVAVSSSQGAIILRIDITTPGAVVFSATGAFAENDDLEGAWLQEGITLVDFFASEPPGGGVNTFFDSSDLASPEGAFAYTTLLNMSLLNLMGPYVDLNISGSGFSFQGFSTSAPALTGSATADLSPWAALLEPGKIGNIYSGDGIYYDGPIIGQYEVVPEPGSAPLIAGAGAAALLAFNRRRRSGSAS